MLAFTDTLPERVNAREGWEYVVTDNLTERREIYATSWELLHDPKYDGLAESRLAECIKYGQAWKNYRFELIEKLGG